MSLFPDLDGVLSRSLVVSVSESDVKGPFYKTKIKEGRVEFFDVFIG